MEKPKDPFAEDPTAKEKHEKVKKIIREEYTNVERAEEIKVHLDGMLNESGSYSEKLKINPDGTFNTIRIDDNPMFLPDIYACTPEELYEIAAEVEKKHPEYHFSFEKDPEGKWMKYTVSKDE